MRSETREPADEPAPTMGSFVPECCWALTHGFCFVLRLPGIGFADVQLPSDRRWLLFLSRGRITPAVMLLAMMRRAAQVGR
jgi:hypothetical protein